MLLPKRAKYRRVHRGRMTGKATRGNTVTYGEWGLATTEPAWLTGNQIEAARIAMTRYTKRGGKVWIKVFPDKPVTSKPFEERRERRPRRDGDRRQGGFNRDNNRGFNRNNDNRGPRREGQGFNRGPRPEKKEGGAQ